MSDDIELDVLDVCYIADKEGDIVCSVNGQIHYPVSPEQAALALNRLREDKEKYRALWADGQMQIHRLSKCKTEEEVKECMKGYFRLDNGEGE